MSPLVPEVLNTTPRYLEVEGEIVDIACRQINGFGLHHSQSAEPRRDRCWVRRRLLGQGSRRPQRDVGFNTTGNSTDHKENGCLGDEAV